MFLETFLIPSVKDQAVRLLTFSCILIIFEGAIPIERNHSLKERGFYLSLWFYHFVITALLIYLPLKYSQPLLHPLLQINLDSFTSGYKTIDNLFKLIIFPFLPFLVFDFFYYWFHRMQHQFPLLWKQHEMHHSIVHMNAINSVHHWTEEFLRVFLLYLPYGLLLKVSYLEVGFLALVLKGWDFFIHSNIRLSLGVLTPIFSGPAFHRVHHSTREEHFDKNFASYFPIYDILFGTYVSPKKGDFPTTGVKGVAPVRSVADYLLFPFVRRRPQ